MARDAERFLAHMRLSMRTSVHPQDLNVKATMARS